MLGTNDEIVALSQIVCPTAYWPVIPAFALSYFPGIASLSLTCPADTPSYLKKAGVNWQQRKRVTKDENIFSASSILRRKKTLAAQKVHQPNPVSAERRVNIRRNIKINIDFLDPPPARN